VCMEREGERERERVSMEDWWYRNWEKITNWWIFEDREKEAGSWNLETVGSGHWEVGRKSNDRRGVALAANYR
jgi:hypothetical protein